MNQNDRTSKKFIPIRLRKTKFNPLSKGINAQFPKILGIALTRVKEKLNSLSVKEEAEYSLKPWESLGIQDREITDPNPTNKRIHLTIPIWLGNNDTIR